MVRAVEGEARLVALSAEADALRSAQSDASLMSQRHLAVEALERRNAIQALRDAHTAELGVIRTKASALEETVATLMKERAAMSKQISELRERPNGMVAASAPPATPSPQPRVAGEAAGAPKITRESLEHGEKSPPVREGGAAEARRVLEGDVGGAVPRTPVLVGRSGGGGVSPMTSGSTSGPGAQVIEFEEGHAMPVSQQVITTFTLAVLNIGSPGSTVCKGNA
jgi:hypothetical protein